MDQMIKMYATNKVCEFLRKRILEEEITGKGKKGAEKLQNVINDKFWANVENFIKNAKEKDNKLIPDFIEHFAEDMLDNVLKEIKTTLDLNKLLESILAEEKTEIGI